MCRRLAKRARLIFVLSRGYTVVVQMVATIQMVESWLTEIFGVGAATTGVGRRFGRIAESTFTRKQR